MITIETLPVAWEPGIDRFGYQSWTTSTTFPVCNNADGFTGDVYLVVELKSLGNLTTPYHAAVYEVLSPEQLSSTQQTLIKDKWGIQTITPLDAVSSGVCALIDLTPCQTLSEATLWAAAYRRNLNQYAGILNFYLDRVTNKIGNDGWDFLRGRTYPINAKL